MIKLYRYGYVGSVKVDEIEAEGETKAFWIIKGRRESKSSASYPELCWHRTPEEAIQSFINRKAKTRDDYLRWANDCQDSIDEATGFLMAEKMK